MFKAHHKISLSLIFVLALGSSAAAAADEVCNAEGYSDVIIKPAKVETGAITTLFLLQNISNEKVAIPAKFDVMDARAFKQLPSEISYEEEICHEAVIESRSRDLPLGPISDFDIIKRADGTEYKRPLELSVHEINKTRNENFIASEAWIELVSRVIARPEPELLPNGQLRVLITPSREVGNCPIKVMRTVTQNYVKSRTPAVIKRKPCSPPPNGES